MSATKKRLPNEQRRKQLLKTAYEVVRKEGTDALTLARVAEQAGVTKPIAYEHFGTRSGLLIAMYHDYDEKQTQAMRDALRVGGRTIEGVASILSAAYVDCAVAGPYVEITAALTATEEMEELLLSCRKSFMKECIKALSPYSKLKPERMRSVMVGILGAADAVSQAAAGGQISRDEAVKALSQMMTGVLKG